MAIVTLLTDFGSGDTYVGQLKGALLSVCPTAAVVDLTHQVPAQNVRAGAFLLWSAVPVFPAGTIHVAVVDPGVGSDRGDVAARSARGDVLIGPDNGLLVPALERLGGLDFAVELSRPEFWRERVSRTFHGRDVFAPAAGHLANGADLRAIGTPLSKLRSLLRLPNPASDGKGVAGEILHIDGYGTLITNIPEELLAQRFEVHLGPHRIYGTRDSIYESVAPGALVPLVGSSGLLEVAARNSSAAAALRASVGDPIRVEPPSGSDPRR